MANCSVLEAHQKPTDKPTRRIKRSGGQSLVRQQLAVWLIENVLLQMVTARRAASLQGAERAQTILPRRYIPAKMPFAELPGLKFQDPVSKTDTHNSAVRRRFFVMVANRIASQ